MMRRKLYCGILAATIVTGVASGAAVRGAVARTPSATTLAVVAEDGVGMFGGGPDRNMVSDETGLPGSGIPAPG